MKVLRVASLFAFGLLIAFSGSAQKDKSKRPSPPAQVSKEVNGTKITIDYSRPSKKGREIFGGLEQYGKVWRTGANETTWIEVSKDVEVEGEKLPAGKYGLFTVPGKDEWTIIFNTKWDGWGAYEYKEADDVLRVKVNSASTDEVVEMFTIDIEDSGDVIFAWDQTKVEFSIR
ncbi:DUF2911 domain-containing protein [Ekhidna sp.]|uniref:DUF2911 domain-containing protein n=1 Tax=Ekhidna sp. TaxID=2608089 RepID=UPI003CCBEB6D